MFSNLTIHSFTYEVGVAIVRLLFRIRLGTSLQLPGKITLRGPLARAVTAAIIVLHAVTGPEDVRRGSGTTKMSHAFVVTHLTIINHQRDKCRHNERHDSPSQG